MKARHSARTRRRQERQRGALLVIVIIGLLASSVLGTALLAVATSGRYQRLNVTSAVRAYYLAECGAAYVKAQRDLDPTALPVGTFTLLNGDRFEVETTMMGEAVFVESLGVAYPNTALEARRQLHVVIDEPVDEDTLSVGFDMDNDGDFDAEYWQVVDVAPSIKDTGPSGGQPALDLKGQTGQIQLNWTAFPELNLQRVWGYNGGLLSYDVQLKIKPFDTGSQAAYSKHYMLGITFRLRDDDNEAYGLSYFRSLADTHPTPDWVTDLPAEFQALRGTNIYVVLWHGFDPMTLVALRTLTPADPVIELRDGEPELRDYSTLLLELKETYTTAGERENAIAAYVQAADVYPLWSDVSEQEWQEETTVFPAPLVWDSGEAAVVDSAITSANFDSIAPAEIGVHVFYDRTGANLKFFDDFAIRMEGYADAIGGHEIQY